MFFVVYVLNTIQERCVPVHGGIYNGHVGNITIISEGIVMVGFIIVCGFLVTS